MGIRAASLLAVALSLGASPNVFAADMPVKAPMVTKAPVADPPYRWTGFYVGANAGGHWGRDKLTTAANTDPAAFGDVGAAALNARSAGSINSNGFFGGAQVGYNWQMNKTVLGVEADGNWLSGKASRSITYTGVIGFNPADSMTNSTHGTWLATVRGRAGVTFDRVLLYATGGVAIGEIKTTDTFCSFGGCAAIPPSTLGLVSGTTTRTGWTVGGGLEYGITNNWSLKAEYLYVDLGSFSTIIPSCPTCVIVVAPDTIVVRHKYTDNIGRFGINYRF